MFNNPLAYTDPTGMFTFRQLVGIAIAVIGTLVAPQFGSVWAKIGYAIRQRLRGDGHLQGWRHRCVLGGHHHGHRQRGGLDFTAFGERRGYSDPNGAGSASPTTPRGFTGHEMVDASGCASGTVRTDSTTSAND